MKIWGSHFTIGAILRFENIKFYARKRNFVDRKNCGKESLPRSEYKNDLFAESLRYAIFGHRNFYTFHIDSPSI